MFDNSFSACTFFFFFKVEIRLRTLISLFKLGSVHSGSASSDDCGQMFPDVLHVSSFPASSSTVSAQQHSQPTLTSLGQGCIRI